MIGCYASGHGERIGDRPAVGDRRTAAAAGGAQAQGRQTSRAQQGGSHRHRLRAQDGHTLGDAPQGDGLRVRFDVLAEAARLAGGGCVAPVAPSLAGQVGGGRQDRLVEGLARFGERGGQKGGEKVGKNPTDRGKPGSKRHLVSDRKGVPLAVVLSAANVHDSKVLEDVVWTPSSRSGARRASQAGHASAQISCTPTRATTPLAAGRRSEGAPSRGASPAAGWTRARSSACTGGS